MPRDENLSRPEKLSLSVSPEMASLLREAIQSGDYQSPPEILGEALRDWCLRREERRLAAEVLSQLWEEGVQSGAPEDGPAALAVLRGRLGLRGARGARA